MLCLFLSVLFLLNSPHLHAQEPTPSFFVLQDYGQKPQFTYPTPVESPFVEGSKIHTAMIGTFETLAPMNFGKITNSRPYYLTTLVFQPFATDLIDSYSESLIFETIEFQEDGEFLLLKLAPFVKFYERENGETKSFAATAEDVQFSIEKTSALFKLRSGITMFEDNIESFEILDEKTLKVHFRSRGYLSKRIASNILSATLLIPKKIYGDIEENPPAFEINPVGSGPYYVERYKKTGSQSIVYKRYESHWTDLFYKTRPYYQFDRVEVLSFLDNNAIKLAMTAGLVDLDYFSSKSEVDEVQALGRNRKFETGYTPSKAGQIVTLRFNMDRVKSLKLRQAIGVISQVYENYSFDKNVYGDFVATNTFYPTSKVIQTPSALSDKNAERLQSLIEQSQNPQELKDALPENFFTTSYEEAWGKGLSLEELTRDHIRLASKLLDEAGFEINDHGQRIDPETKKIVTLTMLTGTPANLESRLTSGLAKILRERLGIEIQVDMVDDSTLIERLRAYDFDMFLSASFSTTTSQLPYVGSLNNFFHSEGGDYNFNMNDPVIDMILEGLRSISDVEQIISDVEIWQSIMRFQAYSIPIIYTDKYWHVIGEGVAEPAVAIDEIPVYSVMGLKPIDKLSP